MNGFFSCFQQDDVMTLDRFLVYGVLYREVRDSLARAILSGNTDELIASLEVKHFSLLS